MALRVCACTLSHVQLSVTTWMVARQFPLSVRFSRQEYWSGLPFQAENKNEGILFPESPESLQTSSPKQLPVPGGALPTLT